MLETHIVRCDCALFSTAPNQFLCEMIWKSVKRILGVAWKRSVDSMALPLLHEFLDHMLRAEVQIDFRGGQVVVAEESLERRQADPLLDGCDTEGVPENMR